MLVRLRCDCVDKVAVWVKEIELLNQNSVDDLNKILSILQHKRIYIDDLEFLIAEDGGVYIADPIRLKSKATDAEMKRNEEIIRLLINVAQEKNRNTPRGK